MSKSNMERLVKRMDTEEEVEKTLLELLKEVVVLVREIGKWFSRH